MQECRVVGLMHTHAEFAHCSHLPGLPVHTGLSAGQSVSSQLPLEEQVLWRAFVAHLVEPGTHPTQAPL